MKNISQRQLAEREEFISTIDQLSDAIKEGHAEVAKAARTLAEVAAAGEEQEVTKAMADVTAACTACHYDVRDKKRREEMQ
jgi:cytochrome c556